MPRLNLGLGNRENVKSSLIKVDLKSNYAQLPALLAFSKGEASSVQAAWDLSGAGGAGEQGRGRGNTLHQNDQVLYDRNALAL